MMAIIQALAAIPKLIGAVKSIFAFIEANKNEAWFQHSASAFALVNKAKTEEEYRDAARKVRDLFGGLK